jgi:hypothetical protein
MMMMKKLDKFRLTAACLQASTTALPTSKFSFSSSSFPSEFLMMFLLYLHDESLFQSSSRIDELIATRFYYLIRKFHRERDYARQDPFKHIHRSLGKMSHPVSESIHKALQ